MQIINDEKALELVFEARSREFAKEISGLLEKLKPTPTIILCGLSMVVTATLLSVQKCRSSQNAMELMKAFEESLAQDKQRIIEIEENKQ